MVRMVRPRSRPKARIAALKAFAHRFSFFFLFTAALGLLAIGRADPSAFDALRMRITDAVTPILEAMSRPAATVAEVVAEVQELGRLREENARLFAEIETLRRFQAAAFRLEAENLTLRSLLNYTPERAHAFITARVVGDNGGSFVRSVAINVGSRQGLRDGQVAMGGRGVVGRTVQVGIMSARVLLITDLNARIPVVVERTRQRAVLAGDNGPRPHLAYLAGDRAPQVGDRIVTSGIGGIFPPGLPVGIVAEVSDGRAAIQPLEDFERLEYLRILDFQPDMPDGVAMRQAEGYAR